MSCCCLKILNLCNKPVCGLLTLDQIAGSGSYTLLLDYLETSIAIVQAQTAGENIFFNINNLNENFQYTGQIFDSNGDLVSIEDSPESYDCIKFRTIMKINADSSSSSETPPVLNIPGTVVIEAEVGGEIEVTGTAEDVSGIEEGSTTITSAAFVGVRIMMVRGDINVRGIESDETYYFTKSLNSDFISLNQPLSLNEYIRIQTIPQ